MDSMKTLVLYAMLGSIIRKDNALSEIDERIQNILTPETIKSPKPKRADIRAAAQKNFKRTMRLLNKETKCPQK